MNTGSILFQSPEYHTYIADLLESGNVQIAVNQKTYSSLLNSKNIISMTPGVIINHAGGCDNINIGTMQIFINDALRKHEKHEHNEVKEEPKIKVSKK
jgi:hypothetical protein